MLKGTLSISIFCEPLLLLVEDDCDDDEHKHEEDDEEDDDGDLNILSGGHDTKDDGRNISAKSHQK